MMWRQRGHGFTGFSVALQSATLIVEAPESGPAAIWVARVYPCHCGVVSDTGEADSLAEAKVMAVAAARRLMAEIATKYQRIFDELAADLDEVK